MVCSVLKARRDGEAEGARTRLGVGLESGDLLVWLISCCFSSLSISIKRVFEISDYPQRLGAVRLFGSGCPRRWRVTWVLKNIMALTYILVISCCRHSVCRYWCASPHFSLHVKTYQIWFGSRAMFLLISIEIMTRRQLMSRTTLTAI